MLEIKVPEVELYDEETKRFTPIRGQSIKLEHSLVSLSKWESRWKKPFLTKDPMSRKESVDYVRHMTITQNVHPMIFSKIVNEHMGDIMDYIEDDMTATTFRKDKTDGVQREIVTSELIYYWMIAYQIPMECQKWHLNRLLTLINICNIKNQPKKQMSRGQILARNHALNAARLKKLNTTG